MNVFLFLDFLDEFELDWFTGESSWGVPVEHTSSQIVAALLLLQRFPRRFVRCYGVVSAKIFGCQPLQLWAEKTLESLSQMLPKQMSLIFELPALFEVLATNSEKNLQSNQLRICAGILQLLPQQVYLGWQGRRWTLFSGQRIWRDQGRWRWPYWCHGYAKKIKSKCIQIEWRLHLRQARRISSALG